MSNTPPWLWVVGIGEDGWQGLSEAAREAVLSADAVIGGKRHLAMIPRREGLEEWPSPMKRYLDELIKRKGENICVLASGDPMFYGIGTHIARRIDRGEMRIFTHISAFAHICAAMGWSEPDTRLITACGRPVEHLHPALFNNARIVFYSADETTPAIAAKLLVERGFGKSPVALFENVGGPHQARHDFTAETLPGNTSFSRLNALAIECIASPEAEIFSTAPGLPGTAFANDGQLTRREVRGAVLARLSPRPGELLWDIGAGSGSIAIEWMRAALESRAIAVEANETRARRIGKNAAALGVPRLKVINAKAPEAMAELPAPDAIFIGGGLGANKMLETCWRALKPGGRLCANAVTLEGEAVLFAARNEHGGEMVRMEISNAEPLGKFTGWKPARPVSIWSVAKPLEGIK